LSLSSKGKPMSPTKRRPQKRKNEKLESATPPSNQNSKIPTKISELPRPTERNFLMKPLVTQKQQNL
jgi:hypothetical protein